MKKWFKSFKHALNGLYSLFSKERNAQIELVIGLLTLVLAFYFEIEKMELLIVIICISSVLGFEALNTSLEKLMDKVEPNHDPLIGMAKDIAAGAVLIVSIASAIIGIAIFYPYFLKLF